MKKLILLSAIIFGTLCVSAQKKWNYPATPAKPVYDTIWGKIIKDDYRWMENTEDPKFTQWLKDQNQFTLDVMNTIPNQDKIYQSWMDIMEGLGVFYAEINGNGHASIYKRATAEENVSKLYYRNKSNNKEEMLFDPETYIEGKMHSITGLRMSDDGKYALFNVSEAGKENGKIRIMDLFAKKLLPEELPGMYASFVTIGGKHHIAYLALDNEDVHKNSYKGGELKLHVPGTKISEDKTIITSTGNPELKYDDQFNILAPVTYNHPEYLIVEIFDASAFTRLYYIRKSEIFGKKPFWKPLVTKDDQQLPMSQFLTGNSLYYATQYPGRVRKIINIGGVTTDNQNMKYFYDNVESNIPESDRQQMAAIMKDSTLTREHKNNASMTIGMKGGLYKKEAVNLFFGYFPPEEMKIITNDKYQSIWRNRPDFFTFDFSKQAYQLNVPLRLIHGRQDPVGEGLPVILNERMKDSKLVFIEQCGHFPWFEQPVSFFKVLNDFLIN